MKGNTANYGSKLDLQAKKIHVIQAGFRHIICKLDGKLGGKFQIWLYRCNYVYGHKKTGFTGIIFTGTGITEIKSQV